MPQRTVTKRLPRIGRVQVNHVPLAPGNLASYALHKVTMRIDQSKSGTAANVLQCHRFQFGDEERRDRTIAERAVSILRKDRQSYDHLLMARVKNISQAEELLPLYQELAPEFNPVVIVSGHGRKRQNEMALKAIRDKTPKGSKIVICVDMLGEGFDLRELKIRPFMTIIRAWQ